ncbi:hypothetical protein [Alkalibacterium subtropicum]|uniref:hypothetical protein n=1 Tax=Alkalibacterium subtropicum TaxID=753702 RepID=UPI001160A007|nr:hypothetical protein [Alkalibacterium subtropicum]
MNRKKVTALLAMSLFSFGLITSNGSDTVSADDPNIVTTMSALRGGWEGNYLGPNGKHWTSYSQRNVGKYLYATIRIAGQSQEINSGSTTYAKVTSRHNVGPYVSHTHNGSHYK